MTYQTNESFRRALNNRLGFLEQKRLITLNRVGEGQYWLDGYLRLLEEQHSETLAELRKLQS